MIAVQEAEEIISKHLGSFGTETVSLERSYQRVLKETWIADRDLPPYDRVTMDGIVISYNDYAAGLRSFNIIGIAPAGQAKQTLQGQGNCLEIMTGAIMPRGADTVIRYEDLSIEDGIASLTVDSIRPKQNVHFRGEDRKIGDVLVRPNTVISSAEIGLGASIGKAEVQVSKLPSVMVISTGDELVPIVQSPLPHQIRRSNVYRLLTTLQHFGINANQDHLNDNKTEIREKLKTYLEQYDAIILSGGVSRGKYDFIPEVLEELAVQQLFHKIKQRPGKPFWFGHYKDNCKVFPLPGNPVSSFLCMHRYFLPWLKKSLGITENIPSAVLAEDVVFKPDLTYFLEIKLSSNNEGQIVATPVKGNGSGDLANISEADAFIQLPSSKNQFTRGEVYPFYKYRL